MISKTKLILSLLCFCIVNTFISISATGQEKRVLFIGNSITYYNNMPQTVKALGTALGDTLSVTMYAPGGTGFVNHHADPQVFQHFSQSNWDYIILQPGSNESPAYSFPIDSTIRWGKILADSARKYNPCAQILLYEISYGVRTGVAQPANYYFDMARIKSNLLLLGDTLRAIVVPAGETILNIWRRDMASSLWIGPGDVHPNAFGSYAIACTFAAAIFKKPTADLAFYNGLDSVRCKAYQRIADSIVFTTPAEWNTGAYAPSAKFTFTQNGNQVSFQNSSLYFDEVTWSFGDGTTSQQANPVKTYATTATYRVKLKARKGNCYDEYTENIVLRDDPTTISPLSSSIGIKVYPNPARTYLIVEQDAAQPVLFTIYNIIGARVVEQHIRTKQTTIDISGLAPGIYSYSAASGTQMLSGKINKL